MENLYGVTIEDMRVAITNGYRFKVSVQNGFVFSRDLGIDMAKIWKVKTGWQIARIVHNNIYENHTIFKYLQNALKREW